MQEKLCSCSGITTQIELAIDPDVMLTVGVLSGVSEVLVLSFNATRVYLESMQVNSLYLNSCMQPFHP